MINSVVLVGRLTRDPDLRRTGTGRSVLSFTLAVRKRFSSQQNQNGGPDADFINCVAWGKTAELIAQYMHKGSQLGVEGHITTRSYDNQQGQRVYVTEVVADNVSFLDSRGSSAGDYGNSGSTYGNNNGYMNQNFQRQNSQPYSNQNYNQNSNYNSNFGSNDNSFGGNPYASGMSNGLDAAFDDDDDSFDIDSDDLPF